MLKIYPTVIQLPSALFKKLIKYLSKSVASLSDLPKNHNGPTFIFIKK